MQKRHSDRQSYFNESAETSRNQYVGYIEKHAHLSKKTKVLEVGCGEGGNLLPFAEKGCDVTGIDRSADRIAQAKDFFRQSAHEARFLTIDFFDMEPEYLTDKQDIILIHDVIEHIEEKERFIRHVGKFLATDGVIFWGFPAWQMPFGGHQQICRNKIYSRIPFVHLLPNPVYRFTLKLSGEKQERIDELLGIKACRTTIESFEKLIEKNSYQIVDRVLWFINPHYQQKFNLSPRKLPLFLTRIAHIRNFFCTSCFYLTRKLPKKSIS